jgi:hypothetical protein
LPAGRITNTSMTTLSMVQGLPLACTPCLSLVLVVAL